MLWIGPNMYIYLSKRFYIMFCSKINSLRNKSYLLWNMAKVWLSNLYLYPNFRCVSLLVDVLATIVYSIFAYIYHKISSTFNKIETLPRHQTGSQMRSKCKSVFWSIKQGKWRRIHTILIRFVRRTTASTFTSHWFGGE